MVPNYFEGGSRKYFGDKGKPKKRGEAIRKPIGKLKISKKYKKRDMKIEIVEYEIKD